jgi:hypothetical protein
MFYPAPCSSYYVSTNTQQRVQLQFAVSREQWGTKGSELNGVTGISFALNFILSQHEEAEECRK